MNDIAISKIGSKNLSKTFKRAAIGIGAFSVMSVAAAPFIGSWAQDTYRSVFHKNPYTRIFNDNSGKKFAPLFIGSVENFRVIKLQEDLLTLGYKIGSCGANGILTDKNITALNKFREQRALPKQGFADSTTIKSLASSAQQHRDLFDKDDEAETLKIRNVQTSLLLLGYDLGSCKIDGKMNEHLVDALTSFQESQPYIIVSGEADIQTINRLNSKTKEIRAQGGVDKDARDLTTKDLFTIADNLPISLAEIKQIRATYVEDNNVPANIADDIIVASLNAGFDPNYLFILSKIESSNRRWAEAKTSDALGLYQFLSGTWVDTINKYAYKYGYTDLAQKLKKGKRSSEYTQVLNMRTDPKLSTLMAIEFTRDNLRILNKNLDIKIGKTELYMAHFMGKSNAIRFLKEMKKDHLQKPNKIFKAVASTNKGVFYKLNGKSRNMVEVYNFFSKRMGDPKLRMVQMRKVAPHLNT